MNKTIKPEEARTIFATLVDKLDRNDLNEILFNWNESELDEATNEILVYVDSRGYGPRTGGASKVEPIEFITWLLSDAPFDTKVYGEEIRQNKEWADLIGRARETIGPFQ